MPLAIKINPKDNVVVALHPIAKGTAVPVDGASVTAVEDIPQGHKMAVRAIAAGDNVIKYGLPIGHVTCDVQAGSWLHTHNVKTNLSGEVDYEYHPSHPVLWAIEPKTFQGFLNSVGAGKAMVVTSCPNVVKSARNIPGVVTTTAKILSVYDIVNAKRLVIDKAALAIIEEVFA